MASKKLNILALSWRGPRHPQAGGAEQVVHEHMKGWIAVGHNVTLFCSSFKSGKKEETIDGIKIIRRSFQYLGVHASAFAWYLLGRHEKYDLVVDQFHGIPFFTPVYVRVPKLAILQEVAREVWLRNHLPVPFNYIIGWIGYLGEPFVFLFYRHVPFMVGSDSAKEDLIKMGISSQYITVVSHGVLITKPRPMPKKEKKKTVVFFGAVNKDKGIEDALKAFSILSKKGEHKFWVIGKVNNKYYSELEKLMAKLELAGKVKFWGFVSEKKKFELLARAHVMVNPSVLEGFGLVNIEANAMGTPVVAYNSRGLIDSVSHQKSGVICMINNPKKLANEVFDLLGDVKRYKKLQKGAISWSKNFTWKKSRKMSLELIENR